jgi:hypothetical protein
VVVGVGASAVDVAEGVWWEPPEPAQALLLGGLEPIVAHQVVVADDLAEDRVDVAQCLGIVSTRFDDHELVGATTGSLDGLGE